MNQKDKNTDRQSIKRQKEQDKNEILSGIIDNESKTYVFEKSVSVNGVPKTGTFKAKYMGVAARLRVGTIRAKLLDGAPSQSTDTLTDDIAYMIAYLQVSLVDVPSWWNFEDLDDIADLKDMYLEVYKFVQSFRTENGQNTNAGNSADASSEEDVES